MSSGFRSEGHQSGLLTLSAYAESLTDSSPYPEYFLLPATGEKKVPVVNTIPSELYSNNMFIQSSFHASSLCMVPGSLTGTENTGLTRLRPGLQGLHH